MSKNIEEKRRQTFKNKALEEILRTHRSNVEIAYKDILSVKVSRGIFGARVEFNRSTDNGTRRKFAFRLSREQLVRVKKLLEFLGYQGFIVLGL